jgi:hypothetical protein
LVTSYRKSKAWKTHKKNFPKSYLFIYRTINYQNFNLPFILHRTWDLIAKFVYILDLKKKKKKYIRLDKNSRKTVLVEKTVLVVLGQSQPWLINKLKKKLLRKSRTVELFRNRLIRTCNGVYHWHNRLLTWQTNNTETTVVYTTDIMGL